MALICVGLLLHSPVALSHLQPTTFQSLHHHTHRRHTKTIAAATPHTTDTESVAQRRIKLLRNLEPKVEPPQPDGPAISDPAAPLALAAVRAADAKRAADIQALRVTHLTSATNFFVNMQGTSKTQIAAIIKSIEDEIFDSFGRTGSRQGKPGSGWVCLDYDEVVVNVFSEKERSFYQMERFWSSAQPLDLSDVITEVSEEKAGSTVADVDDWALDGDDWELDEEDWELGDDWSLGDESAWSLDDDAATDDDAGWGSGDALAVAEAAAKEAASSGLEQRSPDLDEWERSVEEWERCATDESTAEPAAPIAQKVEPPEIVFEDGDEVVDDEEDDWALGDEELRALVDEIETSLGPVPDEEE